MFCLANAKCEAFLLPNFMNKRTQTNIAVVTLLAVFVPMVVAPENVLAFEAQLPNASATALVAKVYLADRDSDLVIANDTLPTSSYTTSAVVATVPSVKTEHGLRVVPKPPIRLASATSTLVLEGEASYYSRAGCLGCDPLMIMANGQPLDDNALTMAIGAHLKHLVGHQATVTSLATGLSVKVLITDTGGFYQAKYGHRVADLTIATKNAIGMKGGLGQVEVVVH